MNLFTEIKSLLLDCLSAMAQDGTLGEGFDMRAHAGALAVEPPRDPSHGDMATNAAMVLARPCRLKPRAIAEPLAARLATDPRIASVEVAGPGFINLWLAPTLWQGVVGAVLAGGTGFARSEMGQGRRVNVEYVSANPTGPLHVGHTRGAVFGDALARLLAYTGHEVTREYYINDGGGQIDTLARSAYFRYLEAGGAEIAIPEGLYPGDYLVPVGQALRERFGDTLEERPEDEWLPAIRPLATDLMMDLIRADLAALGVEMDVFFSEKSLYGTGRIEDTLHALEARDLVYVGTLEPPKGKLPEDWEARPQTLFKATEFGDDVDRPLKKSDGSWTYFAPD
ncbi:MAG: arginine--tRNA ligase, partial [Pseudomonadota bacterium]